jgi:ABC-type methionine transport system ATPase subunit
VYQFHHLLPEFSAVENVMLPQMIAGVSRADARRKAEALLGRVGLAERLVHRPARLSGGEQQRTAIAVALANEPRLLLADEPTGEIDSAAADQVFGVLRDLNQQLGVTVIVVTHDPQVAQRVDRVVAIRDGRTATEIRRRRDTAGDVIHEEEFALLDRVGRLQLPPHFIEALDLKERVRLALEQDHVGVWPDRAGAPLRPAPTAPAETSTPVPAAGSAVDDEDDSRWRRPRGER